MTKKLPLLTRIGVRKEEDVICFLPSLHRLRWPVFVFHRSYLAYAEQSGIACQVSILNRSLGWTPEAGREARLSTNSASWAMQRSLVFLFRVSAPIMTAIFGLVVHPRLQSARVR